MGWTQRDLDAVLDAERERAVVRCRLLRPLAGGQPAGEKALRAFAEHHLGLAPGTAEFDAALARIQSEEIGERETTPEDGEVKEESVYAVNVIRRGEKGPYILEHMVKALLKQAASRMGIFKAKPGAKGDVAEMGTVEAAGESLQDLVRPWEIYLRRNGRPVGTSYALISGSVRTPQGKKSIQHHTETAEEGGEFTFAFSWPARKFSKDDLKRTLAAATKIGIGSCLSLGYGRFELVSAEVD
ncbi:MAG: hypothetical protein ABII00_06725 [Elusimicrobiota bacterium]